VSGPLSYGDPGASAPADPVWGPTPPSYRRWEGTVVLGRGEECWRHASTAVLVWGVKTRSGFAVRPEDGGPLHVRTGVDHTLLAHVGPLRVREPVRVVAVVETDDRCGFAYGTRPGHPVSGEEAFVVHRDPDGTVSLTLRSLTRPAEGRWRLAFPALLLAQRLFRRRYARALR